jgi:ribose transport system substrate-binding protein
MSFVGKTKANEVFTWASEGAKRAASDYGAWIEDQSPLTMDLRMQQENMQDVIGRGTAGIIVSCINDGLSTSIDDALAAGIPVITFDSDCPSSKRLGFFGTDNLEAGRKAADLLVQAMNNGAEERRVAIVTGSAEAINLNERIQGFTDRISEQYPNVTVLAPFRCDQEEAATCSALLDGVVRDHEELNGLFVVGLWGVQGACDPCTGATCSCYAENRMPNWHTAVRSRNLKTVAFDTLPFELQLMRQGYLSALIGQKYYEWGYCTTSSMVRYITRGEPVKFSPSGYKVVVSEQDVAEMTARWTEVFTTRVNASPPDCGNVDAGL